ncbi:hypothetical protein [Microbacterium sp. LWH11-1.2]|uniref:hypothetical protein n=1 Tax=Microbacterium sp. LWH11-1.2 TaxID=3135258 RepID=UPI003139AE17
MSMLHSIFATSLLIRQQAQRRRISAWPAETTVSPRDIAVAGRSLTDLARTRGTPCVLIARAGDADRGDGHRTVVLATVLGRTEGDHRRPAEITVDCDLRIIGPRLLDALLLNGPRTRERTRLLVQQRDRQAPPLQVFLPADTSPGDLLTFVCEGTIAASQVRSHDRDPGAADDGWPGRCMK